MATIEQMKDMLKRAENVLEQAVELKEENLQLKVKLAKYEDNDNELEQNMRDFKLKVELFGEPESRGLNEN